MGTCVCRICGRPVDCGDLLCPLCEDEYADVYKCDDINCEIDLRKLAQRIRRIKEQKQETK